MHENDFYVGIDIGTFSATASYLEQHSLRPVMLDRTGGFGQVYIKTAMLLSGEDSQWLIGEDASHDHYGDVLYVENIMEALLEDKHYFHGEKHYSASTLFVIFVGEILDFIYQINPNAKLKGLCITLIDKDYFAIGDSLERCLRNSEWSSGQLIPYVRPSTETMLTYLQAYQLLDMDKALLFDFGHKGFRAYHITKDMGYNIRLMLAMDKLSGSHILKSITEVLTWEYLNHLNKEAVTEEEVLGIDHLAMTYYPYLFKSYKTKKPLKVPFNFAFPPFQGVLGPETIDSVIEPFESTFCNVIKHELKEIQEATVIVTGNGFRMAWPLTRLRQEGIHTIVEDIDGMAKGAAIYAYKPIESSLVKHAGVLDADYGFLMSDNSFVPVVYSGHHYKQEAKTLYVTMTKEDDRMLTLYKENNGQRETCMVKDIYPPTEEGIYILGVTVVFDEALTPTIHVTYNPA